MSSTDTTIEVGDEAVVSVDVTDAPELADAAAAALAAAENTEEAAGAVEAVEEADAAARAALTEALDKERKAREASDATAASERRRAEEAGRLAASREVELRSSQETAQQREAELLDASLESAQRELDVQQKALSEAMEAGDFKAAAEVQTKIAKAAAKVDRLESTKIDLESGKLKRPAVEGRVEAPAAPSAFEQYVSQYAPIAQTWLRNHPDCLPAEIGGNPVKNAKMMQGHYAATAQGLPPNTPEYFSVIEKAIADTPVVAAAPAADPAPAAAPPLKPKLRQAQPSAPVSREAPASNGQPNKRSVTLNREQQEVARMSFPTKTPQEAYALYARNLLELQAEGKVGRTSH